jgi:type IV pilus assembly protein PilO
MALIPDDPKQRNALVLGILTVAFFYLFWAYWYSPRRTEIEELTTQKEQLDLENRRAQRLSVRGGEDLEERLTQYEQHVFRLERLIPQEEEVAALLNDITAEARRTGVDLNNLEPQPEEAGAFYTRKTYELTVIGDYHDIGRFLSNIASLERIITPRDLDLSPFEGNRDVLNPDFETPLQASLRIQTYVLPPGGSGPPAADSAGQEGG